MIYMTFIFSDFERILNDSDPKINLYSSKIIVDNQKYLISCDMMNCFKLEFEAFEQTFSFVFNKLCSKDYPSPLPL